MTPEEREEREAKSIFTDERYAKKAFKKLFEDSLNSDAAKLPEMLDPRGQIAPQSIIYNEAYRNVENRLRAQNKTRQPTKVEVMIECTVLRGAFETAVVNTIMDRTAGKVKDELQLSASEFEQLSDQDLEDLMIARERRSLADGKTNTTESD